jgi:hypothetical protein
LASDDVWASDVPWASDEPWADERWASDEVWASDEPWAGEMLGLLRERPVALPGLVRAPVPAATPTSLA